MFMSIFSYIFGILNWWLKFYFSYLENPEPWLCKQCEVPSCKFKSGVFGPIDWISVEYATYVNVSYMGSIGLVQTCSQFQSKDWFLLRDFRVKFTYLTGNENNTSMWLQKCCREVEAEVVRNSGNKLH